MSPRPVRTRFAPSPTGWLHLGHAYSALRNAQIAEELGGEFLLRIEDLDQSRCKAEFEAGIREDLAWLGLLWTEAVRRQSEHLPTYDAALARLSDLGLLYPCRCRRRDIKAALVAQHGSQPPIGPDGPVYPGTCRARRMSEAHPEDALRLNMAKAVDMIHGSVPITETGPLHQGTWDVDLGTLAGAIGDVVLCRRDSGQPAYHLAVVLDDAVQEITHVVRGMDLFEAAPIHRVLQTLLDLPAPIYHHHALIRDTDGMRLAKSHDSEALATHRANDVTPREIYVKIAAQVPEFRFPLAP